MIDDRVEWCEMLGTVVDSSYGDESVAVQFDDGNKRYFTDDGRSKPYYTTASLKLVEPKEIK